MVPVGGGVRGVGVGFGRGRSLRHRRAVGRRRRVVARLPHDQRQPALDADRGTEVLDREILVDAQVDGVDVVQPLVVDVAAFASQNGFELNYPLDPRETVVLINIGAAISNINIVRSGVSLFTRDVTIGGNAFTEEIQKQLEQLKGLKIANQTGSSTGNIFVDQLGPKHGLTKGAYQEVRMNVNDMVAAMAAKTVDAMVSVEPYNAIADAEKIGSVIMDFSSVDRLPVYMAATPEFVEKRDRKSVV